MQPWVRAIDMIVSKHVVGTCAFIRHAHGLSLWVCHCYKSIQSVFDVQDALPRHQIRKVLKDNVLICFTYFLLLDG